MIRGVPGYIRSDNGPEFTARAVREWLGRVGARTLYIEPGSPWENGYIESFHGKLRDELLDGGVFYHAAGGEGADRAVQADLQPHQAAQLTRLQAAGAGDLPACRPRSLAFGTNIDSGTKTGAGHLAPPVFLTTAHWYGPVALVLVGLAVWNVLRWRQGDERAALGDS